MTVLALEQIDDERSVQLVTKSGRFLQRDSRNS